MPSMGPMLAWETSTNDGVVCLGSAGAVTAAARFRTVKGHAGWLMPLVESTLKGAGVGALDLGAIAAGTGPGGFTGVKVGVATAKAMAYALGVPLVGVPTLDLMAAHAPRASEPVLAAIDARQGLLYAAGYDVSGSFPRRLTGQACISPAEAARLAAGFSKGQVTLVGFAPQELTGECEKLGLSAREAVIEAPGFPSAATLLATASGMLERGEAGDAFSVVPVYLRKPV